MTEPVDRKPPQEPVAIPDTLTPEIQRAREKFLALRLANRVAYSATRDPQFIARVNDDIADQRTYLESQIKHSYDRIKAFQTEGDRPLVLLPDLSSMNRRELLSALDWTTGRLDAIFQNPSNWGRRVDIPYAPPGQTGMATLNNIALHEAHHEGMNRFALGYFGIPQPPQVTAPFGK